jgi:hypothetical protein
MATLFEYFLKDSSNNLTVDKTWPVTHQDASAALMEIKVKLHLDMEANAKYVSFYFPESDKVELPEAIALRELDDAVKLGEGVGVQSGFDGSEMLTNSTLMFTGRVFLYSERPVPAALEQRLREEARKAGHHLVFRSKEYQAARNKWEKPLAFISHDSRNKAEIAQPLALALQKLSCPVWFDEYSMKVGDSLRESIEAGLKECRKCILILTPDFLRNGGWTKREYDSIFTRELVEQQKVILPVWHGVTPKDVYEYSPILADRVALQWSMGVDRVASKLRAAIESR